MVARSDRALRFSKFRIAVGCKPASFASRVCFHPLSDRSLRTTSPSVQTTFNTPELVAKRFCSRKVHSFNTLVTSSQTKLICLTAGILGRSILAVGRQNTLLRKLRRDREWSLDLTASKAGINVSTLSRVERGLIPASDDVKKKLERVFKRPAGELLSTPEAA
jgi:hypothetical protein